jgi:hypothetical protein
MPRITITNNTRGGSIPLGVALEITAGHAQPVRLAVDETKTFNVGRNEVVRIKPTNTMMQHVNYQQLDERDRALSIILADRDRVYGVTIDSID